MRHLKKSCCYQRDINILLVWHNPSFLFRLGDINSNTNSDYDNASSGRTEIRPRNSAAKN